MTIENKGLGNNVSLQVLDAILCHNGEMIQNIYYPNPKSLNEFFIDFLLTQLTYL